MFAVRRECVFSLTERMTDFRRETWVCKALNRKPEIRGSRGASAPNEQAHYVTLSPAASGRLLSPPRERVRGTLSHPLMSPSPSAADAPRLPAAPVSLPPFPLSACHPLALPPCPPVATVSHTRRCAVLEGPPRGGPSNTREPHVPLGRR